MATNIRQGSSPDWDNTAAWSLGAVPTAGDTVIIPGDVSVSIVTNVDQSGLDLALLVTDQGYVGDIGASGAPLKIAADKVVHRGIGTLYYYSGEGTATQATDWIELDTDGGAHIDGINITRITAEKGVITFAATMGNVSTNDSTNSVLTDQIEVAHRNNRASDVRLTDNAACKASTGTMRIAGGQVTTAGAVPIMEIAGGIVTHNDGTAIATLMMTGGYLYYNSTSTLVTAHVFAGAVLDLSGNSLVKTITTLNVYAGGKVIMDENLVTITNKNIQPGGLEVQPTSGGGISPFKGPSIPV